MGIAQRYQHVLNEVAEQCRMAGRSPEEVTLVAVSKTVGLDGVAEAIEGGAFDFGENRPDQLVPKHEAYPQVNWHMIGNIQSRRIADIVGAATLIHSVNHEEHARKIDRVAERMGKVQDILIEVNVSGEASKSGVTPAEAGELVRLADSLDHVRVRGLMTMAPEGDLVVARETFDGLAALFAEIKPTLGDDATYFDELSMGMSEDWREAIDAGATIVRIGRAIFSDAFEE